MIMSATPKAKVLETVVVTEDLPEYGIKAGEKAVVLEAFDTPEEAYLIEVVEEAGTSSKIADWVGPNQIKDIKSAAKEFLDKGFALLQKGNLSAAERAFKQAIRLHPEDIRVIGENVRWSLTNIANAGEWAAVIELCQMCFRLAPQDEIVCYNLAVTYHNYGNRLLETGKFKEALCFFQRAELVSPREDLYNSAKKSVSATFTQQGIQATQQRDFRAALNYFEWAFAAHSDETTKSNLAKAYFNVAEICLSENNFPEAIGLFEQALLAGYLRPALYNDYALALVMVGQLESAISALEDGYALAPEQEILRLNLQMVKTAFENFQQEAKPALSASEASPAFAPVNKVLQFGNFQREPHKPQFESIPTQEYPLAA